MVASLFDSKMNADIVTSDEWAPLHIAASQGHIEILKILIIAGKANVNCSIGKRGTPLHCAAFNGKIAVASYLFTHPIDPEYSSFFL